MKPPTVFLGEMTDPEVEAFLRDHRTVIVPTGSTEQHGPHGPLLTDVFVPVEVARRVAPRTGALVAPSLNYGLSYPHAGFTGVVHLRIATFMALIEDCRASGWRRWASAGSCSSTATTTTPTRSPTPAPTAAERLPAGARAFPVNYWDGMTADEAGEYFGPTAGLHANRARRRPSWPSIPASSTSTGPTPSCRRSPTVTNPAPVHTAFFFSTPGSVHRATHSGTWGDARESSAEYGERYLQVVTEATVRMLDDIERTFEAMPAR